MTDVNLSASQVSFDGSCKIVPTGSQFVWLRLIEDKKWNKSYQQAMVDTWRSYSSHDAKLNGSTKARRTTGPLTGDAAAISETSVNSLGDIVLKKWCCTRTHQVLAWVFATAEKHGKKCNNLLLTNKEVDEYQRGKTERAIILARICSQRLEEAGSSHLRDWLNRLWVLFVTGIDNDPAGERVLSYDVRKSVHDAQFTNDDAIALQASLLLFLIPSLKYEACCAIATADFHTAPLVRPAELTGFEASQRRSTPPQQQFTRVFIEFIGFFLDTLTEAEIVKAATAFKPAIWNAHQHVLKTHKAASGSRRKSEDISISKGDGIHIDHLDKLGRRKSVPKFA